MARTARTRRLPENGNSDVVILAGIFTFDASLVILVYISSISLTACTACSNNRNTSTEVTEQSATYESAVDLALVGEFRNSWVFTVFG